ncbi:MAG: hypothetical protein Q7R96_04860 [Nanoarchaeota archaeon]|nr:hypothetical protein [Nanoarchaeota archaeon]
MRLPKQQRLTDALRSTIRDVTLGSIIFGSLMGCTTITEKEPIKTIKTVYDFSSNPEEKTGEVLKGAIYGERPKKYRVVYEKE